MKTRYFPGLEREVSVLALGTQAFGTSITVEDSFRMLDMYVENGGNFLDTARLYGYYKENVQGISEYVLGLWMQARHNRDSLVLGTKGAHPRLGHMNEGRLDRASIMSDIETSLAVLKTDRVDIYWLHRDDVTRPVGDIMETLKRLIDEGKTLSVGASNWSPERIFEANLEAKKLGFAGFIASQPQWSLARQEVIDDPTLVIMDEKMYKTHLGNGMPVVAFTSQAKGFFTKLEKGGTESLSPKARTRFLSERNMRTYEIIKGISARTGLSAGAVSLAYLTSQPFPTYPIVGFSNCAQAESMKEAGDAQLDAADLELLNASSELTAY